MLPGWGRGHLKLVAFLPSRVEGGTGKGGIPGPPPPPYQVQKLCPGEKSQITKIQMPENLNTFQLSLSV